MKRITITTTESYVYDNERVEAINRRLQPDPSLHGEEPAYAVWAYLSQSLYGADVFEDQGDFDQGYEIEDFDPDG